MEESAGSEDISNKDKRKSVVTKKQSNGQLNGDSELFKNGEKLADKEINNSNLDLHNVSGVMRIQRPIIESDSEDDTPNVSRHHINTPRASAVKSPMRDRTLKANEESDSEGDSFIKHRKVRPLLPSDSEDDVIEVKANEEPPIVIDSKRSSLCSADVQFSSSDECKNDDVHNISDRLKNSKISKKRSDQVNERVRQLLSSSKLNPGEFD